MIISLILTYMIVINGIEAFGKDFAIVNPSQPLLSFLIIMFYIRILRESWRRIFMVVYDSLAIMVIIVAYILFFSLIGYTLFASS